MNRTNDVRTAFAAAIAVATLVSSGIALADRGGGGDNGDNSMNPFTGDSYAYFHGGHNLGEQGTIRPDRAPSRPRARQDANASTKAPAKPPKQDSAQQPPKRQASR